MANKQPGTVLATKIGFTLTPAETQALGFRNPKIELAVMLVLILKNAALQLAKK